MADVAISGAAGGIGQETVRAFAERGFRIFSLDRQPLPLALAATLSQETRSYALDLTDDQQLSEAAAALAKDARDLRHFVGIAGGALPSESLIEKDGTMPSVELFRASIELNLTSQWNAVHHILPLLEASAANGEDCSITFVSSINALASYGLVSYSAAKAGLIGLMGALCGPLGEKGIRVNVLAPGTVPTPRTRREWEHDPAHFERLDRTTALGRCGTPKQIAESLRALALDLTHVTGQTLVVDGGQMMKRGW